MCMVADRAVAKYIWPNPLVVELGDRILQRNGEIVSGVNKWRCDIEPEFVSGNSMHEVGWRCLIV